MPCLNYCIKVTEFIKSIYIYIIYIYTCMYIYASELKYIQISVCKYGKYDDIEVFDVEFL